MPQQLLSSVQNNFSKGLITEATGLNFPENACTSTENCVFTLIGDVVRREGITNELNGTIVGINRAEQAISNYVWKNVGGDGNTVLEVLQVGATIYFYSISNATITNPLSTQRLASTVNISSFTAPGATFDATQECTFADGNGYLFIFNSNCDPVYCTFNAGTITPNSINVQIRDFIGVIDNLAVNTRPGTLAVEHQYNLQNQGWVSGNPWQGFTTHVQSFVANTNNFWPIQGGLTITPGTFVTVSGHFNNPNSSAYAVAAGQVIAYNSGTGVIEIAIGAVNGNDPTGSFNFWQIIPSSIGYINTWVTAEANYPSNADVWWYFKNSTGVFDPLNTAPNVTLATGNAPQGKYVLPAFIQDRTSYSTVPDIFVVATAQRPTVGAWYAGRIWFSGVAASQQATVNTNYYSWSEDIYFSQVVQTPSDFGLCYQQNDPTSENLFGELATDGGVIRIQGAGVIKKLFPTQNGMLVFATNGVWFITGSQGIGFTANDYTITKISAIRSLNSQSFVDVLGLPYFWNEEGIYQVTTGQSGQISVVPITVGTIQTFYDNIPLLSKKYVRGDYDPIGYVIQWCYRSTLETDVTSRYQFDSILAFNTYNKSFYPYAISPSIGSNYIHGVSYVSYPNIVSVTPLPTFKYPTSSISGGNYVFSFAEEYDTTYVDWGNANYTSNFITGYMIRGQGMKRFQSQYVRVFSRLINNVNGYQIQSGSDYATDQNTGKWSNLQTVLINNINQKYAMAFRKHKLRGSGFVRQFQITSQAGVPFDIMGWSVVDSVNTGT